MAAIGAKQKLLSFFQKQDVEETGMIDRAVLEKLCERLGYEIPEGLLERLLNRSDVPAGMLGYEAFLESIFGGQDGPEKESSFVKRASLLDVIRLSVLTSKGVQAVRTSSTSRHRNSAASLRRGLSALGADAGGFASVALSSALSISTGMELPELDLPPLGLELSFGKVIGRGASGATVLRCSAVPSEESAREESAASSLVPCAAKVLPLTAGTFPDMVEDFGREVSIMRGLKHPSLIGFLGAGWIPAPPELGALPGVGAQGVVKAYVLCIELCDLALEKVVQHRRREEKHFSKQELGPLLAQVVAGLEYLHGSRTLHRDIKSANVFLKYQGDHHPGAGALPAQPLTAFQAKLGDFGGSAVASRAQTPVQTPQWMAPEAMRLEGYGAAADIWGFGMLMYELLELDVPYGEEITMPQLEEELTAGRAPRLVKGAAAEETAASIVALMRRCLVAAPAERPSAQEVGQGFAAEDWTCQDVAVAV